MQSRTNEMNERNERTNEMNELLKELKATVSRAERFLIYGLWIFSVIGLVAVLIGIINQ